MNRFGAISFCLQYGISNSRNGFFTLNIFCGIIHNSSLSKGAVKSGMTISINRCGYPGLLYFALIGLISLSKFDLFSRDLYKFPEMVFHFHIFRNFRKPRYSFFILFSIYLCCYYTFLVQNDFVSINFAGFTLYFGKNYLKLQIIYLVESCFFCCICC